MAGGSDCLNIAVSVSVGGLISPFTWSTGREGTVGQLKQEVQRRYGLYANNQLITLGKTPITCQDGEPVRTIPRISGIIPLVITDSFSEYDFCEIPRPSVRASGGNKSDFGRYPPLVPTVSGQEMHDGGQVVATEQIVFRAPSVSDPEKTEVYQMDVPCSSTFAQLKELVCSVTGIGPSLQEYKSNMTNPKTDLNKTYPLDAIVSNMKLLSQSLSIHRATDPSHVSVYHKHVPITSDKPVKSRTMVAVRFTSSRDSRPKVFNVDTKMTFMDFKRILAREFKVESTDHLKILNKGVDYTEYHNDSTLICEIGELVKPTTSNIHVYDTAHPLPGIGKLH